MADGQFTRELLAELQSEFDGIRTSIGVATLEGLITAVELSPVDTGLLRNSWQIVDSPNAEPIPTEARDGEEGDPPSARQLQEADEVLSRFDLGEAVALVGGADYTSFVNDGTDRVDPRPMAEPAIASIETVLRAQGFEV